MSNAPYPWLLEFRAQFNALARAARRFQDAPTDSTALEDVRKQTELIRSHLYSSLDLDYNAQSGVHRTVIDLRHDWNAESIKIALWLEIWLSDPEKREQWGNIPAGIATAAAKLDALLCEAESRIAAEHD